MGLGVGRSIIHGCVLAQLERTDVGHNRPPVVDRYLRGVARHRAEPIGHHVKEVTDRSLAQCIRVIRGWRIKSALHNDAVEQCVKSNVNRLRFPAKGGIANVNYPFVFTQGG